MKIQNLLHSRQNMIKGAINLIKRQSNVHSLQEKEFKSRNHRHVGYFFDKPTYNVNEIKLIIVFYHANYVHLLKFCIINIFKVFTRRQTPKKIKKSDPVAMYHQHNKEWNQSAFLRHKDKRSRGTMNTSVKYSQQRLSHKKSTSPGINTPPSYIAPNEKRRDSLRMEIRSKMIHSAKH